MLPRCAARPAPGRLERCRPHRCVHTRYTSIGSGARRGRHRSCWSARCVRRSWGTQPCCLSGGAPWNRMESVASTIARRANRMAAANRPWLLTAAGELSVWHRRREGSWPPSRGLCSSGVICAVPARMYVVQPVTADWCQCMPACGGAFRRDLYRFVPVRTVAPRNQDPGRTARRDRQGQIQRVLIIQDSPVRTGATSMDWCRALMSATGPSNQLRTPQAGQ